MIKWIAGTRVCADALQLCNGFTIKRRGRRIYRRNRWKLIGHCARPPHRKLGLINLAFCNQSSFCCKLLRQQRALTLRKGQMNCWYNAEILFDSLSPSRWNKKMEKKISEELWKYRIKYLLLSVFYYLILSILLLLLFIAIKITE